MLETSRAAAALAEARAFADRIGLRPLFEMRLAYLDRYAAPRVTRCVLFPDPAPYSFYFVMQLASEDGGWTVWFVGKLLYRGPHDAHGSVAHPDLAAPSESTMGWQIDCATRC